VNWRGSTARRAYLDGWQQVPVYRLDDLAPAQALAGPVLVESETTTVLLRAGERALVTPHGWLDVRLPAVPNGSE